jgi:hypothetical protein
MRWPQFGGDFRPGIGFHVAEFRLLPGQLGMRGQVLCGDEIVAASVTRGGGERQLCGQRGVGSLVLHGACSAVGRLPGTHAARRQVHVAAQRSFAGLGFSGEGIHMIGQEFLRGGHVNLAFVFLHKLFPADAARVTAEAGVFQVKIGFLGGQFRADGIV